MVKHIKKEKRTTDKGEKKDMKKEETEFKKVILMTIRNEKRGNENKRKGRIKNKRMLEEN
jgi:hypothetical protein